MSSIKVTDARKFWNETFPQQANMMIYQIYTSTLLFPPQKHWLIGALEVEVCPVAAASLCSRAITWLCCSLLAWSRILLARTESAPCIHWSLKFWLHGNFDQNLVHTVHFSFLTTLIPPSTTALQSTQVTLLQSQSNSCSHFWNVVYCTFSLLCLTPCSSLLKFTSKFIHKLVDHNRTHTRKSVAYLNDAKRRRWLTVWLNDTVTVHKSYL